MPSRTPLCGSSSLPTYVYLQRIRQPCSGKTSKGHGWEFAHEYLETLRLERSSTFQGYADLDLKIKEEVSLNRPEQTKKIATQASRSSNHGVKKRRREDPEEDSSFEVFRSACFDKNYCWAFNKGTCKQPGSHTLVQKMLGTSVNLQHLCAKCDGKHPASQCTR